MQKKFTILPLLILLSLMTSAQENNIKIGAWRVHLAYTTMKSLAVGKDKVYAANGSSILFLNRGENSLEVVSKNTGLNDVMSSVVGYNATQNVFIIGYETGNIDMVNGNEITNVNDILRNNIAGSKKINHVMSSKEYSYLSGDYGVVLYNLSKKEVTESYLTLAPNSGTNPVYASALTTDKDSIFLATSRGVMAARIHQSVNLLAFSSWYTFQESDSIENSDVVSVCAYNNVMYAAVLNKGIYYLHGTKWRKTSIPMTGGGVIRSLTKSDKGVMACVDSAVFKITSPFSWTTAYYKQGIVPVEANYDSENILWIASDNAGLIKYTASSSTYIYPNGPLSKKVFRLGYYENNLIELSGGYNAIGEKIYSGDWFSTFENNTTWTSARNNIDGIPGNYRDFIGSSYNSANATLYISTYGNGLIGIKPDKTVDLFRNAPFGASGGDTLLGEIAIDSDANLWVPNKGASKIHKLSAAGEWTSYSLSGGVASNIIGVTIDDFNNKWMKTISSGSNSGIVIFNEKTGKIRTLTSAAGQGNLPDVKVNCITKDKKGNMIIGTDQGIAISYDPDGTLNNGNDLITPIYDGFPLLYERNVLAIEVDGGNRKWVGTNDGLWLFNDDMTKVLQYFDTYNSPLLSDYIMDIQIHELSGEVFFATEGGIVSYRGDATEGDDKYSNVKVFPNPVKPGFNGMVGISGLAAGATVKITDVAGNLVYQTDSNGGTAVWNVKDYNGKKVATGVYLIFSASAEEGSEKFVSKISVIE